jgi:hypothetical protein
MEKGCSIFCFSKKIKLKRSSGFSFEQDVRTVSNE